MHAIVIVPPGFESFAFDPEVDAGVLGEQMQCVPPGIMAYANPRKAAD
jgi:hypothetical protein